jgi:hypothetical protein
VSPPATQLGRARGELKEAEGGGKEGAPAVDHGDDRRLLVIDRRGGLGGRGARISSRSGQPILGARRRAVVDGGIRAPELGLSVDLG